jgi:hypothetical protein
MLTGGSWQFKRRASDKSTRASFVALTIHLIFLRWLVLLICVGLDRTVARPLRIVHLLIRRALLFFGHRPRTTHFRISFPLDRCASAEKRFTKRNRRGLQLQSPEPRTSTAYDQSLQTLKFNGFEPSQSFRQRGKRRSGNWVHECGGLSFLRSAWSRVTSFAIAIPYDRLATSNPEGGDIEEKLGAAPSTVSRWKQR